MNEQEYKVLKEIANILKAHKDAFLMEVVPSNCGCKGKTVKSFRNPEAFQINLLLEKLKSVQTI